MALSESGATPAAGRTRAAASAADLLALTKPRVMALVVFTAFVGMALAPGGVDPVRAALALAAIAVGAGAAGAFNMWWEADIDALMARTRGRPIPSGRVAGADAVRLALVLAAAAVLALGLATNWLAAGLLAFTIFFYAVVYTMVLKRRTAQNIVIGGAAGALPPVIGWAAATGDISLAPLVLFAIIFMWTPPHFWALALVKAGDYARAGVPMLPVVAGEAATRRQIAIYAVILAPLAVAPWALGHAGPVYGIGAILLGLGFLWLVLDLTIDVSGRPQARRAIRVFLFSIAYLFGLNALLLADAGLAAWGVLA